MSAVFHYSFSTVMPIILLILVGVLARHRGYLDVSAFRELNRFNFRYALFARVFVSIYQIESIQLLPCRADGEILFSLRRDLSWLYSAILSLSRTATPMALIILGGQLELKEIEDYRRELISGVLVRLAAGPLIGFAMLFLAVRLRLLVITPVETAVFVALFASPQAVSSTVMSTEMGGDGHLAGQIVVWSSIQ